MHPYYTNSRYQCPETGLMMPWYVQEACAFIRELPLSEMRVFEYGIGYGTPWYKAVTRFSTGVDDSPVWARAFDIPCKEDKESYLIEIDKHEPFDIIVVDGAWRRDCILKAIERIKPGGFIIADNWNQPSAEVDWGNTAEVMKEKPAHLFHEQGHPDWKTIIWQL